MSGIVARAPSILFVDESNTRLGFMAERLAKHRLGERAMISSAGTDARESVVSPRAIACLASLGVSAGEDPVPRQLTDDQLADPDLVIALSRCAAERCRRAGNRLVVWSIPDPWQGSDADYWEACDGISTHLEALLAARRPATIAA
jgi:protein-tyrosine-phosphatase